MKIKVFLLLVQFIVFCQFLLAPLVHAQNYPTMQKTSGEVQQKTQYKSTSISRYLITLTPMVICAQLFASIFPFETFGNTTDWANQQTSSVVHKSTQVSKKASDMLQGYPMLAMTPYIARKDPQVAAFLVAIAKIESAWGKRSPKLKGKDCYNYWGFRQKRTRMGAGGYTCFDSPKEAVEIVGNRIEDLIDKNYDTPQKMVVAWKCGYNCRTHSTASVKTWVHNVDHYYDKVY